MFIAAANDLNLIINICRTKLISPDIDFRIPKIRTNHFALRDTVFINLDLSVVNIP